MTDSPSDLGELEVAQTGWRTYAVTNTDPSDTDGVTAYTVDLSGPDCDCQHGQQGPEDPEVCKHIQKAVLVAPSTIDATEIAAHDLRNAARRAEDAVSDIRDVRDQAVTAQNANAQAAAQGGADGGERYEHSPPVVKVRDWLESKGVPVGDGVDVYEHDEYDSVQIEKVDQIDNDEFQALKDATSHDLVKFDQNGGLNFVREEDVDEVVG